ncbi:MAG TPA: hypothetical protein VE869_16630 [Gemmatimonas sp.]|nr:hypothetical protein [Gemmatimonas sp.]
MIRSSLARAALLILASAAPTAVRAQVGHLPDRSPYRDVTAGQSLTLSGGWLAVKRDPADVAPKASAFGALRYDVPVGGPASLYVRYMFAPSERRLLAPANPAASRVLRMQSVSTSVADLGIELSLTGRKTWKQLSPTASAGVGLATDFAKADTGAYRFGTRFAFTYGLGMRYMPSSRYTFRADLINYTWQYQYPDRYFIVASDSTSILTDTRKRSAYRGNWALSAGVTIPIFR